MSTRFLFIAVAVLTFLGGGRAEARRPAVAHRPPTTVAAFTEGGYADRTSVMQGSAINLHISSAIPNYQLRIVNLAHPETVLSLRTLPGTRRDCSGRGTSGCGWPVSTTIDIPQTWTSGYYAATFATSVGERSILFVVREDVPGSWSRTVVVSPTHTYQAYNAFGGRSFYPSDDPNRMAELSFDRPYLGENGLGRYLGWEKNLVDWMTAENRRFEVITDSDMEDPTILARYDVVVLPGHSEYWTSAARENLERFSRSGRHVAILGGNTMWWQVRLANDGRTIIGYKGAPSDPLIGKENGLVTTNWFSEPVNDPENRVLGASFRNGGLANRMPGGNPDEYELLPLEQRTPWTVTDAQHWIFAGTSLSNGATFGRGIAGLEVDGVVFHCGTDGRPRRPDGSDEAPLNYHILATIPATEGWGTMGFFVNSSGGGVFNAATQGWVWGLADDENVQRMTRNVLDRFATAVPFVYDQVQTSILVEDTFNCPATLIAQPGWNGDVARGSTTASCAYEGPGGLELSGIGPIALSRRLAPATESRDHVELRFYVKADDLASTAGLIPVATLRGRTGATSLSAASVEIDSSAGLRRIRVARRGPDGFRASDFLTLSSGWHLVEMSWRSPGAITLQIDGGASVTLDNPHADQRVSELVLAFPESVSPSEAGRLCVDAVAASTQKIGPIP